MAISKAFRAAVASLALASPALAESPHPGCTSAALNSIFRDVPYGGTLTQMSKGISGGIFETQKLSNNGETLYQTHWYIGFDWEGPNEGRKEPYIRVVNGRRETPGRNLANYSAQIKRDGWHWTSQTGGHVITEVISVAKAVTELCFLQSTQPRPKKPEDKAKAKVPAAHSRH